MGYSMSIVRQNGMNHWLRILRLVHGSVVPVTRAAIGGLRTATIVSATKPYSVSMISYFSGLGWLMSPNVPLCTKAKCALSNEFSIIRNAEQPPAVVELMDAAKRGVVFLAAGQECRAAVRRDTPRRSRSVPLRG